MIGQLSYFFSITFLGLKESFKYPFLLGQNNLRKKSTIDDSNIYWSVNDLS
jgi:hypothetical protein